MREGKNTSFMAVVQEQGFTLVELIVVMAILAVLAAFAVPKFTHVLASSREKACMANVKLIQGAANLYATTEPNATELTVTNLISTLSSKGYLQDARFKCPVDHKSYGLSGNSTGYTVTCPNGCDGEV